jgi:TolB-like protein/Tfp pilus assembly protein PilF
LEIARSGMATVGPTRERDELGPERIVLRRHLEKVFASQPFAGSKRAKDFLQLVVGHALEGQVDSLRERMIGAEMFGRPVDYDTGNDPVVRVKAGEVRRKLAQYYAGTKEKHAVRIELPSGHYLPCFHFAPSETVAPPESETAPSPAAEPNAAPAGERSAERPAERTAETTRLLSGKMHHSARILGGIALGLVLLAMAGRMGIKRWRGDSDARREIRSIIILPLQNLSGDREQEYIADGMTEELINSLGQVSTLRVISLTSAMSYKGTKKKLPEIARELDVDGVVEGAVQRDGSRVRISAQLIDARTDRPIWAHAYIRDFTGILALQGEVARDIADEVSINKDPVRKARFASARPVNTDAEDLYLQGMFRLNANDFKGAINYFQKAIAAFPNYAQAHAALASCYGRMGESGLSPYAEAFLKQKTEASKAIELDDSLPEGHAELANAAMNLNWDWGTAAREFSRAQEINPSSASVHERYAIYLERTGKLADAIAEAERGVELDPISARSFRNAAFTYYFSRQYDQSLSLIRRAHALNINIGLSDESFLLGDIYAEEGMYGKSIAEFLKLNDSPHLIGHLGNAYARAGQADAARKTIAKLEEHVRKDGVGGYEIALVYAGLGKKNEAFKWLEESYKANSEGLTNLKIDPCLDPLRSDPRFDVLVRRVGLPR